MARVPAWSRKPMAWVMPMSPPFDGHSNLLKSPINQYVSAGPVA